MSMVEIARELRKTGTPTERKVWEWVRGRRLDGHKFRRQHPIGRFILDFYCLELKLGLELEGGVHNAENAEKDAERARYLRAAGIELLFLPNELVLSDPAEAHAILRNAALNLPPFYPPPSAHAAHPSPRSGEGGADAAAGGRCSG